MFHRQLGLLAIATLLLSPSLVNANEIDNDRNLSVGNVRIINTSNGTLIQTPNIQVNSPTTTDRSVLISRIRRRTSIPAIRRIPTTTNTTTIRRTTTRTSAPLIFNNKINSNSQQTTVTTTTSPLPNTTVPTPTTTIRSSTIRTSSEDENSSQSSTSEQQQSVQQSVQCSGGSGTVVSQSSSTVNGRTVNSEVRRNCN